MRSGDEKTFSAARICLFKVCKKKKDVKRRILKNNNLISLDTMKKGATLTKKEKKEN